MNNMIVNSQMFEITFFQKLNNFRSYLFDHLIHILLLNQQKNIQNILLFFLIILYTSSLHTFSIHYRIQKFVLTKYVFQPCNTFWNYCVCNGKLTAFIIDIFYDTYISLKNDGNVIKYLAMFPEHNYTLTKLF